MQPMQPVQPQPTVHQCLVLPAAQHYAVLRAQRRAPCSLCRTFSNDQSSSGCLPQMRAGRCVRITSHRSRPDHCAKSRCCQSAHRCSCRSGHARAAKRLRKSWRRKKVLPAGCTWPLPAPLDTVVFVLGHVAGTCLTAQEPLQSQSDATPQFGKHPRTGGQKAAVQVASAAGQSRLSTG